MDSFNHAVIVPAYLFTGDIVQILETLPAQFFEEIFLSGVQLVGIEPVVIGPVIGVSAVLNQDNRAGMLTSQQLQSFFQSGFKIIVGIDVRDLYY